ncbi:MAG TPA: hypothetical protein VJO35_05725 [Terriglobales bacterium]|nr:hypothetical protein [Terriglobales bacterium]
MEYFKFRDNILFGNQVVAENGGSATHANLRGQDSENGKVQLPFEADAIIDNLRLERYVHSSDRSHPANSFAGRAYYYVRPLLPVNVRYRLQKLHLRGWDRIEFPHWPVDQTVDNTMADLLLLCRRAHNVERIPFVWFWPDGATSAAVVTHDVETAYGRDLCGTIMDIDDGFGIKASFQVVPERRYKVTPNYIDRIWRRGFEVAVHDLNHDGHLYSDRETFRRRAVKINEYRKKYRADGFRAAVLYRNQEWYDSLDFSYDSSVPNVAHLDPQRGGCCTVMPYFVGDLVELPVTLTQDYSLFHILGDYSIDLWKRQIDLIMQNHGLINVIIHPDYATTPKERAIVEQLLSHLAIMRDEKNVWAALPKDVARWWKQRNGMRIIEDEYGRRIEGEGNERARLAYASERDGKLVFEICSAGNQSLTQNSHSIAN